jgi:hypothetical protein
LATNDFGEALAEPKSKRGLIGGYPDFAEREARGKILPITPQLLYPQAGRR